MRSLSRHRQSTRRILLALAFLLPAGCAGIPTAPSPGGELITYETHPGPWCGRCDTIKIVAASDGRVWIEQGHWAGHYSDWRISRRYPRVTPERFARFRARLAPFRPSGELELNSEAGCETLWTHMSDIVVQWRGGGGDGLLRFNFGCDPQTRAAMAEALQAAPAELGIRDLRIPGNDWISTTPT